MLITLHTINSLSSLCHFPRCVFSYPVLADGTTKEDYDFALDVLNTDNCVTLQDMKMERRKRKKNPTPNQPSPGEYEERVSTFDIGQWELDGADKTEDLDDSEKDIACRLSYDDVDNTFESVFGTPIMPQTSHLSRLHEKSHCHISPTTDKLHKMISQRSPKSPHVHTEQGIQASRRNILENLDWMLKYGDPTRNANTSRLIRKVEQTMQLAREYVMRDVLRDHTHPPPGSISFAAIKTRKQKPQPRLKGPAG